MSAFKDFPGLENLEKNSRTFKDIQRPARALNVDKDSEKMHTIHTEHYLEHPKS